MKKEHRFVFNPADGGGESLMLETIITEHGDPGMVNLSQRLTLQSYCNSASFELSGAAMTPEILRRLADELEELRAEAVSELLV